MANKSLKFNKKTDYTKVVKWIGSSVEKIEDIESEIAILKDLTSNLS